MDKYCASHFDSNNLTCFGQNRVLHPTLSCIIYTTSTTLQRKPIHQSILPLPHHHFPPKEMEDDHSQEKKKCIVVGPWGGHGGMAWDDGFFSGIREITLVYTLCIDSFRVVYDKNGKPFPGEKHGGVGGDKTAVIKLHFPDEYLTCVSGHILNVVHGGSPVIRSLTFKSNQRTFGPYGVEHGIPFSFPMEGGKIVGFKGRSGWYLDSIGFYITPLQTKKAHQRVPQRFKTLLLTPKGGHENQSKATKNSANVVG